MATAVFDSVLPRLVPVSLPEALRSVVSRVVGLDEAERIYSAVQAMGDRPIAERLLEYLGVRVQVSDADLRNVPLSGAAILTCNHPFGILDGAVLAALLRRLRPDVRFLANGILAAIPELADVVIPVDPSAEGAGSRQNSSGLRRALAHLRSGGMLVVFPAGEVSHWRWQARGVSDGEWNPAVTRIARLAQAPVVPAYIAGSNSVCFQAAGLVHPQVRTALLARELLNKRGRTVEVRIGAPVPAAKLAGVEYLRFRTDLLGRRERREVIEAKAQPIVRAIDADVLASEVGALVPLERSGDLEVYLADAAQIPKTLLEIARLREVTFRAAGEGTGKPLDLDRFDQHYLHLFVWHARRREIVGAYRLAPTDTVPRHGLYTETLFRYRAGFFDKLGPALELGRSFVRVEYQKGFAPLMLLWKGIGAFLRQNPRYKILFGAVSISNQYSAASRELMVAFLEKHAMLRGWSGMVRSRTPFRGTLLQDSIAADVEDLGDMLSDIEQKPTGVPVLLKQYLRLGGKLLGFNVDPKFANALDGLILVDLTKTEPKLLERYLGKKGTYGTHENISLDQLGAASDRRDHSLADALL